MSVKLQMVTVLLPSLGIVLVMHVNSASAGPWDDAWELDETEDHEINEDADTDKYDTSAVEHYTEETVTPEQTEPTSSSETQTSSGNAVSGSSPEDSGTGNTALGPSPQDADVENTVPVMPPAKTLPPDKTGKSVLASNTPISQVVASEGQTPARSANERDINMLSHTATFALVNNTWQDIFLDPTENMLLKVDIGVYRFKNHFTTYQQRSGVSNKYRFGTLDLHLKGNYVSPVSGSDKSDLFSLTAKLEYQVSKNFSSGAYLGTGRPILGKDYTKALFLGLVLTYDKIYFSSPAESAKVNKLTFYASTNFAAINRSSKSGSFTLYNSSQIGAAISFAGWRTGNFGINFFTPIGLQLLTVYHHETQQHELPTLSMDCGIGIRLSYRRMQVFTASYRCELGTFYTRHSFEVATNFGF